MIPKKLNYGDTIGVVAPSGPVTKELLPQLERGVNFFESLGFKVKLGKNVLSNSLKYSATAQEKADDLNQMFADQDVAAIIAAQGGQNSNSVLSLLDFGIIKKNPKIFLGISDISVLLNSIYQETGLVTFHGNDVMWGFGREHTKYDEQEFIDRLIKGKIGKITQQSDWQSIRNGIAEGILIGGNLNCINKLAGTKYCPDFSNKILFLESYEESSPPDQVEAELYRLKQMGVFNIIKGLWLGHYNHDSGVGYEQVVMNVVREYELPVLKCDDFGHNTANTTIPIGIKVRMNASNKEIILLEKCVE